MKQKQRNWGYKSGGIVKMYLYNYELWYCLNNSIIKKSSFNLNKNGPKEFRMAIALTRNNLSVRLIDCKLFIYYFN